MKKERLVELDAMRGIAFLFIVLQHTLGGFSYRDDISFNDFLISKFVYTMAQNGVQFFIFLTALSLVYTYYEKFNVRDFYIKKLKFLILPFVIWSLIIMINNGDVLNSQSILVIFSGGAQYHLWYMGMILRIYLYFPIILWIVKKISNRSIYFKGIVFLVLTYLYWVVLNHYEILDFLTNIFFENPTDAQKKLINVSPLFYYIYFVIGVYAACNYKKFKEIILKFKYAVIGAYILCFGFYYYIAVSERWIGMPEINSTISMSIMYRVISILFFYLISCVIAQKLKIILNILKYISRYSFPAYLIHVMVLNKLTLCVSLKPEIMYYIRYFFFAAFISIGISTMLNYIPYSEYIIGIKSKIRFYSKKENVLSYGSNNIVQ